MTASVKETLQQSGLYTRCYCEENVYNLAKLLTGEGSVALDDLLVVFVSNENKSVPFWCQLSSAHPDGFVLWDYHVVLVQRSALLIWDLDSTLPCPCALHQYICHALHPEIDLLPSFQRCGTMAVRDESVCLCRMYRLIAAEDYLNFFASDRRHMVQEDGGWLAPPPSYSCISNNKNEVHTLEKYWTMHKADNEFYGSVLDECSFLLQHGFPSDKDRESKDKKGENTSSTNERNLKQF